MTPGMYAFCYAMGVIVGLVGLIFGAIMLLKSKLKQDEVLEKYQGSAEAKSVFVKKYPESDVRNYTTSLVLYGAVLSLGLCIALFSYRTYVETYTDLGTFEEMEEFEIEIPPTNQKPPPPPPPPPPEVQVVDDEEIIEEEPEIEDVDVDEDEVVEAPDVEMEEEVVEEEIFQVVEDMPRFPGCEDKGSKQEKEQCAQVAMMKFLAKVDYPEFARENDIEGRVIVQFVVGKDGSISDVKVLKGAHKTLDAAAIKHLKSMPKWIPGKQRGKPVKVYYRAPFRFRLG